MNPKRLFCALVSVLVFALSARGEYVPASISNCLVYRHSKLSVFSSEWLILCRSDGTYQTILDQSVATLTTTVPPRSGTYTYQVVDAGSSYTDGHKGVITFLTGSPDEPKIEFGLDIKISSGAVYVDVFSPAEPKGPVNVSNNTWVPANSDHPNITGFSLSGYANQWVLIRVVGPSLSAFNVASPVARPVATLNNADSGWQIPLQAWSADPNLTDGLRTASALAGAFPLMENSGDLVSLQYLSQGNYTVVSSSADQAGTLLVEVYALHYQ